MSTLNPIPEARIELPYEAIASLCQQYGVTELAVFGSVLDPSFRPDSDLDLLVAFRDDNEGPWLEKHANLQRELSELLGRPVDLVSKRDLERSDNYIRRRQILSSARVLYVA